MSIRTFALTYPQLMSQALAQGMDTEALGQLRQAYEMAERIADGLYRGQGVPFVCHLVRTASIVLAERQPVEVVTASLLHSAYMLHCFEGCLRSPLTPSMRRQLQQAVPMEVEALVVAYDRLPWRSREAVTKHVEAVGAYSEMTRRLLVMRLANELEDYLDLGMAYRGAFPYRDRIASSGDLKVELARRLGLRVLAEELHQAYAAHLSCRLPARLTRNHAQAYELPRRRWGEMPLVQRAYTITKRRLRPYVRMLGRATHG